MLNINRKHLRFNRCSGFSLIELMLAMVIGLIIMGGVMKVYISSRDTQRSSEDQLNLLADARFAMETIAYDLRHTGIWGQTNEWKMIACHKDGELSCSVAMTAATNDCAANEYINFKAPLSASNNSNPFAAGCATKSYKTDTDTLGMRYADASKVATADLVANQTYVRSNIVNGQVFKYDGADLPDDVTLVKWDDNTVTSNHRLVSQLYYVSDYTNVSGDGVPSLHRASLEAGTLGPEVVDRVLLPGVDDFQVMFGIDDDGAGGRDGQVNAFVNADDVADWTNGSVVAVKVWVLMRSSREDRDSIGGDQKFNIPGHGEITYSDGHRRFLISSVVKLRNMSRLDLIQ